MKTSKLVTGIITLAFTIMVFFQSCAAGAYNTLEGNGESSGTAGFFVAVLMIAGGIINIVTRKSDAKGGSIAALIIFLLASLIGFTLAASFDDLKIWAGWCLIMAIMNIVDIVRKKKG